MVLFKEQNIVNFFIIKYIEVLVSQIKHIFAWHWGQQFTTWWIKNNGIHHLWLANTKKNYKNKFYLSHNLSWSNAWGYILIQYIMLRSFGWLFWRESKLVMVDSWKLPPMLGDHTPWGYLSYHLYTLNREHFKWRPYLDNRSGFLWN